MTATTPPPGKNRFDPDEFRMTIGEHLEELRRRIIHGFLGFIPAVIIGSIFAKQILSLLCRPLINAEVAENINPQFFTSEVTEGFMRWVQISLYSAALLAGPWFVRQLWLFIASGLYPSERKAITKYIPLATVLMFSGVLFVYFIVLPLTLRFFIAFSMSFPISIAAIPPATTLPSTSETFIQPRDADPPNPKPYQFWYNRAEHRIKCFLDGQVLIFPPTSDSLIGIHLELSDYLDLVFRLFLTFALCFQMPLVVLVLVRLGIIEIEQLRRYRRHIYFGMAVLAAAVSPGDVVTATIALLAPLILLYEFGIILAKMNQPKETAET